MKKNKQKTSYNSCETVLLTIEGKPSEVKNLVRQSLLLPKPSFIGIFSSTYASVWIIHGGSVSAVQLSDFKVTMQQDSTVEHQHVGTFGTTSRILLFLNH